ncbi:N-acetyltransferase [Longispora fulva]|uniref:RimJ/RimL family protein N-acetyltransferase n=1 Tax=Longispora fulva TaxID=619741 RepID=A0A8J7G856_9ACTN|nr:GNAT family N-acetyltransferase [Longispora fulva]MBG6134840.1 RimJ/RimL family protein N-acetyltransferase [Longispora fulva]GIG56928.1 N-acetyltransferase [Longispora fulva]
MINTIRVVRADEWPQVKELRLAALRDPVAHLAFLDTYELASARPDEFWQERTRGAAEGGAARQFVAEDADGRWLGGVTALVELPGAEGAFGETVTVAQTHIVGVYVRPEARGAGLAEELFRAALDWSWTLTDPRVERVRLFVHQDNARAEALYAKVGFRRTGVSVPVPADESRRENELAVTRP